MIAAEHDRIHDVDDPSNDDVDKEMWWGTALIFNCFSKGCDLLYTTCRLCIKVRLCLLSGVLSAPTRPLKTLCLGEGHLVEGEP